MLGTYCSPSAGIDSSVWFVGTFCCSRYSTFEFGMRESGRSEDAVQERNIGKMNGLACEVSVRHIQKLWKEADLEEIRNKEIN